MLRRRLPAWLGPAMPPPPGTEIARAAIGAALGLVLADLALWLLDGGGERALSHVALVAPFGATAYLVFSLPNSPLAQPWSAVMGNSLSALMALVALHLGLPLLPTVGIAVLLAMAAMALGRAMHPPGGAVAIATVLLAQGTGGPPGWLFVLNPILSGSAALVAVGMLWNPLTGRHYPFRQPTAVAGAPSPADRRQTPGPLALASALDRLRMGANLGVEDLSRLIAAAETIAAAEDRGPMTAAHVMSRDPIALPPGASVAEAAEIFRRMGFRHLPLIEEGAFLGLVPHTALLGPLPGVPLRDLAEAVHSVPPETPLVELLQLMATGRQICIPVVREGALKGLITRTDLLAAMTHGPVSRQES